MLIDILLLYRTRILWASAGLPWLLSHPRSLGGFVNGSLLISSPLPFTNSTFSYILGSLYSPLYSVNRISVYIAYCRNSCAVLSLVPHPDRVVLTQAFYNFPLVYRRRVLYTLSPFIHHLIYLSLRTPLATLLSCYSFRDHKRWRGPSNPPAES